MKRILAMLLMMSLAVSMIACGKSNDNGNNAGNAAEETVVDDTEGKTALDILNDVWAGFPEDGKFAIAGGDYSNMTMDVPGTVAVADAETLDALFGFPSANASMLDDGASFMHMMNQNTFTAAAFHVTDAANVAAVADAVKENILVRQWMCGFPEELIVYTVGNNYVVMAFGAEMNTDNFQSSLEAAYASAKLVHEEDLDG